MDPPFDIAIVGGGAAGLATAIFSARSAPAARIVVLDSARTLGAKILVSGGGRCNVTNRRVDADDFNGGSRHAIARVLRAFPADAAVRFFAELGVPLHEEPLGKLFPDSHRARTVLDALLAECAARAVVIRTGSRVDFVRREADGFVLEGPTARVCARRVALATGGLALPKSGSDGHGLTVAQSLGHRVVPTTPALVPLVLGGHRHTRLAGVSYDVRLTLTTAAHGGRRFAGSLLWTHVGVSGPVVLDASRHWLRAQMDGHAPSLAVGLTSDDFPALEAWLIEAARVRPRAHVATVLGERLPSALASELARHTSLKGVPLSSLERAARRSLVHALSALPLDVTGSRGYTCAEATAGGVDLSEVDPATMASRRCPGLVLVGEILDVDGRLGGFNFQWAWSSAFVAGSGLGAGLSGSS